MIPRWAKLVDKWQQEGHVGLTPSFLIGALRTPVGAKQDARTGYTELGALLESMGNDRGPYGKVARIFECPNLLQPVVSVSDDTAGYPIGGASLPVRLYVWPWDEPERSVGFDWLLQTLWHHFREPICDGRFSYQRSIKSFTEFSADDRAFVERALVSQSEDDA
jgi:hypothetical protein